MADEPHRAPDLEPVYNFGPEMVTVRSSETDLTYKTARHLAEANDTLTILDAEEIAESKYDDLSYAELQGEIRERNEQRDSESKIPAAGTKADLIAALAADDN